MGLLNKLRNLFSRLSQRHREEPTAIHKSLEEIGYKKHAVSPPVVDKRAELEKEKEEIIQKRNELKERLMQIEEMYESGRLNWATRETQVREILKKLVSLRRRLNRIMRELSEINVAA